MKKLVIIIMLLGTSVCLKAAETITYIWEAEGVSLKVTGNYGTPLGEKIRSQNDRAAAYRLFNLMRSSGKDLKHEISYYDFTVKNSGGKTVDISEAVSKMGIDSGKVEEFAPYYEKGRLWNLKWEEDFLSLEAGEVISYRNREIYSFCGKKKENILINKSGELRYLDEVDWLAVPALSDYSVSKTAWVSEGKIISYAQNIQTGKNFLVISRVRKDEAEFIPAPPGEFKDLLITEDAGDIYALTFFGGVYNLAVYVREESKWEIKNLPSKKPLPLGIFNEEIIWYAPEYNIVHTPGGGKVEGFEVHNITLYLWGDYSVIDNEKIIEPAETKKITVLFYDSSAEKKLDIYGISGMEVRGMDRNIWIMPAKYRGNFDRLPAKPGGLSLNKEDKIIYFDSVGPDGLRNIGSIQLSPAFGPYAIFIVIVLVVALLVFVLKFKRRRYKL